MFWGITCESGKRYSQVPTETFHVSMAALEPRDKIPENKHVSLMLEHKGKEFLLCTLDYERILQVNLNLQFGHGEEMFFFINGEGTIHLSGYLKAHRSTPPQLVEDSSGWPYQVKGNDVGAKSLLALDDSGDEDEDWIPQDNEPATTSRSRNRRHVNFEPEHQVIDDEVLQLIDEQIEKDFNENDDDDDDDDEEDDDDNDQEEDDDDEEDGDYSQEDKEDGENAEGDSDQDSSENADGKRKKSAVPQPSAKRIKKEMALKHQTNFKGQNALSKKQKARQEDEAAADSSDENNDLNSSIGRTPMPKKSGLARKVMPSAKEISSSPVFKHKGNVTPAQQKCTAKHPSGVEIKDIRIGHGPIAKKGRCVHVYYVGKLAGNNREFDSAVAGKDDPLSFRMGQGEVIEGWDVGIEGMRVGGKRVLKIPPNLAYGKKGSGPIPANSTLVFTIDLKAVS